MGERGTPAGKTVIRTSYPLGDSVGISLWFKWSPIIENRYLNTLDDI